MQKDVPPLTKAEKKLLLRDKVFSKIVEGVKYVYRLPLPVDKSSRKGDNKVPNERPNQPKS